MAQDGDIAEVEEPQELGDDYFQQRHAVERQQRQLVRQLERLGHKVTLEPIQVA